MSGTLYFGDNLDVLREHICDGSVDLIYLDPPFNSAASYNVLFKAPDGKGSTSQIRAFEDSWSWCDGTEIAYDSVLHAGRTDVANVLRSLRQFLGENDLMAYICMMSVRLLALHDKLKNTGSIYLHCDPNASHYLKIVMDSIFGPTNFRSELIWKRTASHGGSKKWGPVHDVILFYTKSKKYTWNRVLQPYEEDYLKEKYRHQEERGIFQDISLTGAEIRNGDSGRVWKGFNPNSIGRHWSVPRELAKYIQNFSALNTQQKLDALESKNLIYWPKKKDGEDSFPRVKQYAGDGIGIQDCIFDIKALRAVAV